MTKKHRKMLWFYSGIAAVSAIWIVSAIANYTAGRALSGDPGMSNILGIASVACDILKAAALFVVIGAAAHSRWVATGVAVVLFAMATTWSLRSATYFAADAIASRQVQIEHDAAVATAQRDVIETKSLRAKFLAQQKVDIRTNNKRLRRDAIEENKRSAEEFDAMMAELQADIAALKAEKPVPPVDPLARILTVSASSVALATSISFALLLEIAASAGFWVLTRARPHEPPPGGGEKHPEQIPVQPQHIGFGGVVVQGPDHAKRDTGTPQASPRVVVSQQVCKNTPTTLQQPTPVAETPQENPVQASQQKANVAPFPVAKTNTLVTALVDTLEPAPGSSRVLMPDIQDAINPRLPSAHKITSPRDGARLAEALREAIPGSKRKRVGGKTYAYGVKFRGRGLRTVTA